MTAQIPDQFLYNEHRLELVGIKGEQLTTANDFGIPTASASTGCWRGYVMTYTIIEKQLFIESFLVNTRADTLPDINGISPTRDHELCGLFKFEYKNIHYKLPFNGSLWLAKDFIDSEYVHMGFQSPTAYRTVLKFDFEDGIIVNVEDKSKEAEISREKGGCKEAQPKSMSSEDLNDWIMKRFSLDIDVYNKKKNLEANEPTVEEVEKEMLEELEILKKLKKREE